MKVVYFVRWVVTEGNEATAKALLKDNFERIATREKGNVVFVTHQSVENPREFWMYEVWEDQASVDKHESSKWFKEEYKATLRPIVDPNSIIFGNAQILHAKGLLM